MSDQRPQQFYETSPSPPSSLSTSGAFQPIPKRPHLLQNQQQQYRQMRPRPRSRSISPQMPETAKKIIQDTLTWILNEIRDNEMTDVIQKELIDPLLKKVLDSLFPYIIMSSVLFLLVIVFVMVAIAWFLPGKVSRIS
jgi:hypothetical protein